jgi:hypothetical protein
MFYESCLVSNPFYGEYTLTEEDCVVSQQNIRHIKLQNAIIWSHILYLYKEY